MIDVAEAVHFAHKKGFVHRDLKPANILLDSDGKPHVVDFGLSLHESDQRRQANKFSGTLAYMSPEQVRGETHRLDGRADVWALGAILYEILTGRRPFDATTGTSWPTTSNIVNPNHPDRSTTAFRRRCRAFACNVSESQWPNAVPRQATWLANSDTAYNRGSNSAGIGFPRRRWYL